MRMIIDTAEAPNRDPSLRERIASLKPGQSLLAEGCNIKVLRTTVSRVKASLPEATFTTAVGEDGPRVWRLS